MLNVVRQLGPLMGTRLCPDEDKPDYIRGISLYAGFMMGVFCLSMGLRLVLVLANATAIISSFKSGERMERIP